MVYRVFVLIAVPGNHDTIAGGDVCGSNIVDLGVVFLVRLVVEFYVFELDGDR